MLVRAGRLSLASHKVVGRGEIFHHLLLREWKYVGSCGRLMMLATIRNLMRYA